MRTRTFTGQQMQEAIDDLLVPWAEEKTPFVLLDTPPRVVGENRVTAMPGPQLPAKRGAGSSVRVQSWPEAGLNALSVPYFGCVTEGEADIVIGTTAAICARQNIPGTKWVVQMPQGSMFLLPPGVPITDGGDIQWQRPEPEKAYSRILWMQIHRGGGNCHFSTTTRQQPRRHPYTFIYSEQLLPLAFSIITEMQRGSSHHVPVVYHQLGLMMRYMQRAFEEIKQLSLQPTSLLHPAVLALPEHLAASSPPIASVAQRAVVEIQENLRDNTLTVETLAQRLQISPAQLNRIFRREYDSSVMAFVLERRLELARQLLAESSYNINQVSMHCGYGSASAFIKAFTRSHGLTPAQYRERQHTNARPYR